MLKMLNNSNNKNINQSRSFSLLKNLPLESLFTGTGRIVAKRQSSQTDKNINVEILSFRSKLIILMVGFSTELLNTSFKARIFNYGFIVKNLSN